MTTSTRESELMTLQISFGAMVPEEECELGAEGVRPAAAPSEALELRVLVI